MVWTSFCLELCVHLLFSSQLPGNIGHVSTDIFGQCCRASLRQLLLMFSAAGPCFWQFKDGVFCWDLVPERDTYGGQRCNNVDSLFSLRCRGGRGGCWCSCHPVTPPGSICWTWQYDHRSWKQRWLLEATTGAQRRSRGGCGQGGVVRDQCQRDSPKSDTHLYIILEVCISRNLAIQYGWRYRGNYTI